MKKGNILAGIFGVLALVGTVFALNPSVFTDLKATNLQVTTIYDNASTPAARLVPGTTNALTGNLTVSGTFAPTGVSSISTMTVSGQQGLRFLTTVPAASTATLAPAAAGIMVLSDLPNLSVILISTGTGAGAWVRVGQQ